MIDSKQIIPFNPEEVYDIVSHIPIGKVITYGEIETLIGRPRNSRLVGHKLKNVDSKLGLPCHRVVNSNGGLVPNWEQQRELLENEGVVLKLNGCVDMKTSRWNPLSNL